MTRGKTISGMARSTRPESLALVANIMTIAPMNIAALRRAIEAEVENAVLTWVVSAVSRDITSPERERS